MTPWPAIAVKNRRTGEKNRYRLDQEEVRIGRDSSNYIVLASKSVSRRHAEITKDGDQYFVTDLKSNNGTKLNETKLKPQEKILLRQGDAIQIEDFDLIFQIPSGSEAEDPYEATDSDILEIKMVKKLLKAMDRDSAPSLEILEGSQRGERFVLDGKRQEVFVGRDVACEFRIDADVISRKHSKVTKKFDTVILRDLKSKNGTFVNKEKIEERTLRDGDLIHFGTISVSFRNPQELSLGLAPPKIREKPAPPKEDTSPEIEEPPPPPKTTTGGGKATRKRQEKLVDAAKDAAGIRDEEAPQLEESETAPKTALPVTEILMIVLGLAVLAGSIWAILKLL